MPVNILVGSIRKKKKMKKQILVMIMLGTLLTGCNQKRETVTTCKGNLQGVDETFVFTANQDHIQNQQEYFTFKVEDLGYSLDDYKQDHSIVDKEQLKQFIFQTMFNGIDELDGMSIEIEDEDDSLKFTITTDYEKVDLEALSHAGLIDSGDYISLDKTVDGLKDKGMTCEEK